mmetsp:Transcript_96240/g.310509  ORF Transcript_96240/g.310509 Transcript_96240/m.310509 type:complete len:255 (-) Transcript_96240:488-1252(-)
MVESQLAARTGNLKDLPQGMPHNMVENQVPDQVFQLIVVQRGRHMLPEPSLLVAQHALRIKSVGCQHLVDKFGAFPNALAIVPLARCQVWHRVPSSTERNRQVGGPNGIPLVLARQRGDAHVARQGQSARSDESTCRGEWRRRRMEAPKAWWLHTRDAQNGDHVHVRPTTSNRLHSDRARKAHHGRWRRRRRWLADSGAWRQDGGCWWRGEQLRGQHGGGPAELTLWNRVGWALPQLNLSVQVVDTNATAADDP